MDPQRGTRVVLRDGSEVVVDQVHRTDAELLAEGFARLSDETRRLRFLTAKPRLTTEEIRYFTHVDHHDHEAIGAMDPTDGRGVGLARFIRDTDDPEVAEFAVTVADDWQGRGLGSELLRRIMQRAREEGIHRFSALVEADNDTMIHVLYGLGGDVRETESGAGAVGYEITLPTGGDHPQLLVLLGAIARRQCRAARPLQAALAELVSHRPADEDASRPPTSRSVGGGVSDSESVGGRRQAGTYENRDPHARCSHHDDAVRLPRLSLEHAHEPHETDVDEAPNDDVPPVMMQLLQLEAEKPGSLRPRVAAELCGYDTDLLLQLIRWNEQQEIAWSAARDEAEASNDQDEAAVCEHERAHVRHTVKVLRKALRRVLLG